MKTMYAYLRALLKGSRICWAEAQHEARNMISIGQVISEVIGKVFLRIACAVQSYKLFIHIDVANVAQRYLTKIHVNLKQTRVGRYLIRTVKAETDLRKIVKSRDCHC